MYATKYVIIILKRLFRITSHCLQTTQKEPMRTRVSMQHALEIQQRSSTCSSRNESQKGSDFLDSETHILFTLYH